MNFFEFTKSDYEFIVKECMLNDEYAKILEMKIQDYSRQEIADEIKVDVKVLDNMIRKLKKKIRKII